MAKPEQIWPGERMRAFFRAILASEPALDDATRARLVEKCARRINRMLVWSHPAEEPAAARPGPAPPTADTEAEALLRSALAAAEPAVQPTTTPTPPFDPYAFSAVAVLTREGPDALLARLAGLETPADLVALAHAQHLAIPDGLTEPAALRQAILTAAETRIADRRAAAS